MLAASLVARPVVAEVKPAKVHLVLVAAPDENPVIVRSVAYDKDNVRRAFQENVPEDRLEIHDDFGPTVRREQVMAVLKGLRVEKHGDSVVFYFTGHGAFDEKCGHFFCFPRDNASQLLRADVERAIIDKKPRTGVVISDCCAFKHKYEGGGRGIEFGPLVKATQMSPLFRHLLFEMRGFVSITSSKPGEISECRLDDRGGLFTYPFVDYLRQNTRKTDSWEQVVDGVARIVKQDFNAKVSKEERALLLREYKQTTQTVWPFIETPAFGARVKDTNGKLTVVQVVPLSPAEQAGMKTGQVVLKINGKEVHTEKEYADAVDHSSRTMRVMLHAKKGPNREVTAELNK